MSPRQAKIINRGRGPEISGTRITVYDVLDYRKLGWHRDRIAAFFRLSSADIAAAFDYIDSHKAAVMAEYGKMLERSRNPQYTQEVRRKLDQCKGNASRRLTELRRRRKERADAQDHA